MDKKEVKARIETIYWVTNVAFLSYQRYKAILQNPECFKSIFPGVRFENPNITHEIENHGIIFRTTKREILTQVNHDLYKAWQIVLGITGMSLLFDDYLKTVVGKITGDKCKVIGIFDRFSKISGIKLEQIKNYTDLRHYHEVRNISLHNLGRVNKRFKKKTSNQKINEGAYVFYPTDLEKYANLINEAIDYIESYIE